MAGLKDSITRNHYIIVQSLDPNIVLPYLQSKEVISSLDVEVIDAQVTEASKCAKILSFVHKKGIADISIYQKFMEALKEAEGRYGEKVKFIIERILSDNSVSWPNWSTPRSEEQRFIWLHIRHVIADSLDVSAVIDWLISEGVVDHEQAEAILYNDTMVNKAKRLLKVVEKRGAEGYVKFREALDKHGYSKLASMLSSSDNDSGCLSVFVCLSVCLFVCLCVFCVFSVCLCVCLCLFVCLCVFCVFSVCLCVCLCLFVCLSVRVFVCSVWPHLCVV